MKGTNTQVFFYDKRVQLPTHLPAVIAQKLIAYIPVESGKNLLEVGIGSFEVSKEIIKLPFNYIGFDRSDSLVESFLQGNPEKDNAPTILTADENEKWPVEGKNTDILFSSKGLHLLDPMHVFNEINRIKGTNGLYVITGGVRKDPNGLYANMRKKMRLFMEEEGIRGKGGKRKKAKFHEQCIERGASLLQTTKVDTWEVEEVVLEPIQVWKREEGLDGVSGNDLESKKEKILRKLEDWAIDTYGDLSNVVCSRKTYELNGAFFPNNN